MPSASAETAELRNKIQLLREAIELLMWELSAISERKWEDLPELKRRKGVIAERLRVFDWSAGANEAESLDVLMLKTQITDLERQSEQRIAIQMKMIRQQIDALREQQLARLECINVYCRKMPEFAGLP